MPLGASLCSQFWILEGNSETSVFFVTLFNINVKKKIIFLTIYVISDI